LEVSAVHLKKVLFRKGLAKWTPNVMLTLASRREVLVGTNQYPNFNEVADVAKVKPEAVTRKTHT
jgi:methylmalonyl-CoA mutase N-terminal domain/subunit